MVSDGVEIWRWVVFVDGENRRRSRTGKSLGVLGGEN